MCVCVSVRGCEFSSNSAQTFLSVNRLYKFVGQNILITVIPFWESFSSKLFDFGASMSNFEEKFPLSLLTMVVTVFTGIVCRLFLK